MCRLCVAVAGFPASSIRPSISGRGLPAAADPRGARGHPQRLQLQQLRHGLWVLLLAALGTTEVDIAGLGRHSVPDQLI